MDIRAIYNGKKVFLTGHTGFKGSWLLTWLHSLGAIVKGYSLAPDQNPSLYKEISGNELCESSIFADIKDKKRLKEEILKFEPDFVFHLAAQPLVRLSYEFPTETFEVNAIGTANVLDSLRFLKKPCVSVMITTDKVYHNLEINYPYKETDRLGGYDPYSASKACSELIISSYLNSYFNLNNYKEHSKSISVARAGNVIGGGDWAKDRIIPDIVRALSMGEKIIVRNPNSIRPWQHVLEPLHGYLILGAHQAIDPIRFASEFNLGPYSEDVLKVEELVNIAIENWGEGTFDVPANVIQPHEAGLLQLDITKALTNLSWEPKMNATQAIEKTIDWYRQFYLNKNALDLTRQQINEFINNA